MKRDEAVVLGKDEFAEINKTLATIESENFKLSESLQNVQMMVDAKGWSPIYDHGNDGGLSLDQLHDISEQLRELVVGNPWVKRGSQLRNTYVWGAGLEFSGVSDAGKSVKLTAAVRKAIEDIRNDRYLFSGDANEELERAAYTDGHVFALGDIEKKTFQRIQLKEITGDLRNPENTEEIWAYRRSWSHNPNATTPVYTVRWYYTDIFDGTRQATISHGGKDETVDRKKTMIDKSFNRQVGWAYGAPDALAIIAWAKLYKEFLVNGYIMSRALAQFAYKVTVASAGAHQNASVAVARPGEGGSTAVMGGGNDLTPINTAGKGYDFDSGRPLAAAIAAGVEVSLVALLSDPGAGGGSYGTAQTLDAPARATATMRRKSWDEFWTRILRFLGNTKRLKVTWHDLTEDQMQRILQTWTLAHNSGLFEGEVIQRGIADAMGIAEPGAIPDGYLRPNNKESLNRKDIDADGEGGDTPAGSSTSPTAGSGQGTDDGTGDTGNDHDTDVPA